jgi:hypothetical protein
MGAPFARRSEKSWAIELFELLRGRETYDFEEIATGDESWFHRHYEPREMFAFHEIEVSFDGTNAKLV